MSERVVVAVAAATAVCAPQAVACAVPAQNEMNFGFTPLRTADTTTVFVLPNS